MPLFLLYFDQQYERIVYRIEFKEEKNVYVYASFGCSTTVEHKVSECMCF